MESRFCGLSLVKRAGTSECVECVECVHTCIHTQTEMSVLHAIAQVCMGVYAQIHHQIVEEIPGIHLCSQVHPWTGVCVCVHVCVVVCLGEEVVGYVKVPIGIHKSLPPDRRVHTGDLAPRCVLRCGSSLCT